MNKRFSIESRGRAATCLSIIDQFMILLPVIMNVVINKYGWRQAYAMTAAAVAVCLLLSLSLLKDKERERREEEKEAANCGRCTDSKSKNGSLQVSDREKKSVNLNIDFQEVIRMKSFW